MCTYTVLLINNTQDLLMIRGVCITFENLDSIFINGLDHEIWLTNEATITPPSYVMPNTVSIVILLGILVLTFLLISKNALKS